MKHISATKHGRGTRLASVALFTLGIGAWGTASANHTVLVEGEQDFDGDGVFGAAEDSDGDQVFGSLSGGVNGVSSNGRVMVVTSGRFFEQVNINPNGVVVLEAVPGVNAVVEAFNAGGDNDANNRRQQQPGIRVLGDGSFPVEIRNIVSRNWTVGIYVADQARVNIDDVRVDSNVNYGIQVRNQAAVDVVDSQVKSSGFRASGTLGPTPGGDVAPSPGIGISYEGRSTGFVANTTVAHSFAAGIAANGNVTRLNNIVFNNNPDIQDGNNRGRDDDDDRNDRDDRDRR